MTVGPPHLVPILSFNKTENKLASMVDLGAQRELANLYQIGSVAAVYLSIHVEENGHLVRTFHLESSLLLSLLTLF
jgi:hypothetical protein